ncbi:hypothetical protein H6P81_015618 [Aristolochia fimbriata]|uniref:SHSP domain-containing protein n=1 Tax=Aristolochia fimbriata TaxID=158543 RepID=A0AAV7E622_ARIFI|nr:hypothetical protein H6P81_015618 [Aristolochia fimbriata]
MELDLGLKITRARESVTSGVQISKRYGGPFFTSTEIDTMFILVGHLPGFKKTEIKIDINESGSEIAIDGQTCVQEMAMLRWRLQVKEPTIRHFRKVFKIPDNVILDEIKAWFDDEETSLTIFMPKLIKGIQRIQIEEVKKEQVDQEKVTSTEKTQADGAETSAPNEAIQTQVDEMLPRIDSEAESGGEGEISELNHFVPPGEAGAQEETKNSDDQTSEKNNKVKPCEEKEKETSQTARSERNDVDWGQKTGEDEISETNGQHIEENQKKEISNDNIPEMIDGLHAKPATEKESSEGTRPQGYPIFQSEVDQVAKQDQEILNSMNIEPDLLHQSSSPEEEDDSDAVHEIQNNDTMEALECPPEVEENQTEEPEEASILQNPVVDVPKPAYETQEKLTMYEEDQLNEAAHEKDEEHGAEAADSSESGRTPNNQDIVTSVSEEREKRKRYDGRPYTVIAGSAFLVSLIVLTVHFHRSKKQN